MATKLVLVEDRTTFINKYVEWKQDMVNGSKLRLVTNCFYCKKLFAGPMKQQEIKPREYACPECMGKLFQEIVNIKPAAQ